MPGAAVELVVVVPVGPRCQPAFIGDTLASVEHYTTDDRVVILVDDSGRDTCAQVRRAHPDVQVWTSPHRSGRGGHLYRNLAHIFGELLERYHFEALLRLDTDALVIGPAPEDDAIAVFRSDPLVAAVGNHRFTPYGQLWDRSWPIDQLHKHAGTLRSFVRRPIGSIAVRTLLPRAVANGYEPGESVFGGACFYSEAGLRGLQRRGWLPHWGLSKAYLEEDHMFSLTLRACGFRFADLWELNESFACIWGTLPAPPDVLAHGAAKVTHSVRSFEAMEEAAVRAVFRSHRQGSPPSLPSATFAASQPARTSP